jgi:hypothetical protein
MAAKLRRAYLESILSVPERPELVQPLTWGEFAMHYGAILLLFVLDWGIFEAGKVLFFDILGYESGLRVWGHLTLLTVAITALLYIYFVYIVGAGSGGKKGGDKKAD